MSSRAALGCTVSDLLAVGHRQLQPVAGQQASAEALVLAVHVLNLDKASLLAHPERGVEPEDERAYRQLLDRRERAEPVAYIIGRREFYARTYCADRRALIPRPETEQLVELALDDLRGQARPLVVDVGTGSGILAATVALEAPHARVVASDLSEDALSLARKNLQLHGLLDRVKLVRGDLLSWLDASVELVVANLPYVPSESLHELPPDVREHEPRLALDGGTGGTRLLARLLGEATRLQFRTLIAELDPRHANQMLKLARELFPERQVSIRPDLAGLPRVLCVRSR